MSVAYLSISEWHLGEEKPSGDLILSDGAQRQARLRTFAPPVSHGYRSSLESKVWESSEELAGDARARGDKKAEF